MENLLLILAKTTWIVEDATNAGICFLSYQRKGDLKDIQ
jgi:hypothetical protein